MINYTSTKKNRLIPLPLLELLRDHNSSVCKSDSVNWLQCDAQISFLCQTTDLPSSNCGMIISLNNVQSENKRVCIETFMIGLTKLSVCLLYFYYRLFQSNISSWVSAPILSATAVNRDGLIHMFGRLCVDTWRMKLWQHVQFDGSPL